MHCYPPYIIGNKISERAILKRSKERGNLALFSFKEFN